MNTQLRIDHPTVIIMLGYPGSGKSYTARQLATYLRIPRMQANRIRHELFENPSYLRQEDEQVNSIFDYTLDELVRSRTSVVCDGDFMTRKSRKLLSEYAEKHGMKSLIVWVQTDIATAQQRATERGRKKLDDIHTAKMSEETFDRHVKRFKRPEKEEFVVVSGKHAFKVQAATVVKKLQKMKLVGQQDRVVPRGNVINKPAPKVSHGRINVQ